MIYGIYIPRNPAGLQLYQWNHNSLPLMSRKRPGELGCMMKYYIKGMDSQISVIYIRQLMKCIGWQRKSTATDAYCAQLAILNRSLRGFYSGVWWVDDQEVVSNTDTHYSNPIEDWGTELEWDKIRIARQITPESRSCRCHACVHAIGMVQYLSSWRML